MAVAVATGRVGEDAAGLEDGPGASDGELLYMAAIGSKGYRVSSQHQIGQQAEVLGSSDETRTADFDRRAPVAFARVRRLRVDSEADLRRNSDSFAKTEPRSSSNYTSR